MLRLNNVSVCVANQRTTFLKKNILGFSGGDENTAVTRSD